MYATIAGESEEVIGEIDVTSTCKLAVSAFHVNESRDFGAFKITKLQFHKTHGSPQQVLRSGSARYRVCGMIPRRLPAEIGRTDDRSPRRELTN